MAKNNYYAVRIGKTPGIYKTWEDCKAQVIGYKGAIYKGFAEKQDAEDFLREGLSASSTDAASDNDENPQVEPSVSEITAYGD